MSSVTGTQLSFCLPSQEPGSETGSIEVPPGPMSFYEVAAASMWCQALGRRWLTACHTVLQPARLADFVIAKKEAPAESLSLVTGARWGRSQGSPESVPSSGCLAVCSGVGWLPPSRSARSPVTQSSPGWLRARPPREGLPSQTQTACIDMWMLPGLFTVPNCRT